MLMSSCLSVSFYSTVPHTVVRYKVALGVQQWLLARGLRIIKGFKSSDVLQE